MNSIKGRRDDCPGNKATGAIRIVCACGRVTYEVHGFENILHTPCCGLHPTLPAHAVLNPPPPPTECIDCGKTVQRIKNTLYCAECGAVRRAEIQQRYKVTRAMGCTDSVRTSAAATAVKSAAGAAPHKSVAVNVPETHYADANNTARLHAKVPVDAKPAASCGN